MNNATARMDALRRGLGATLAIAALGVTALVFAPTSGAVFGDRYGAAPINGHPEALQDAPAIPSDDAFWAGSCDRGSAPTFGEQLAPLGGFGARRDKVLAGRGSETAPRLSPPIEAQSEAPATAVPDHCLEWGAQTLYVPAYTAVQKQVWQSFPYQISGNQGQEMPGCTLLTPPPLPAHCDWAPSWRLPASTLAGGHPDGTSMLAWNRTMDGAGTQGVGQVDGSVDNIYVDLPAGFVGNPQAVPECTNEQFREKPLRCPPESQVGILRLNLEGECAGATCNMPGTYDATYPVYNLEPRKGKVAELGFAYAQEFAAIRLVGIARTNGDFGVTAFTGQIPAALTPISQQITLWGVPWAAENDAWRTKLGHKEGPAACRTTAGVTVGTVSEYIPPSGLPAGCEATWDPSWGEVKPFLTNETDCNPAPTVRLATDSFQHQGAFTSEGYPALPLYPSILSGAAAAESGWKTYKSDSPAATQCGDLGFEPELALDPTSSFADGATGLRARVDVPQNNTPLDEDGDPLDPDAPGYLGAASSYWDSDAGRATAHLKDSVVTLPPGVSLNPSAATGLQACSDSEIGYRTETDPVSGRRLFNNGDPFNKDDGDDGAECPDGSKIGTALVNTPLLEEPLHGDVVLGRPETTNPRGDGNRRMFRLFIVVRDPDRGLVAKIYGSSTADGNFGDGGTGQLVTTFENNPELPFDDLTLDIKGGDKGLLALPQGCGSVDWTSTFTPWSAAYGGGGQPVDRSGPITTSDRCANGFGPTVAAGATNQDARARSAFSFHLSRPEGDQTVSGLSVRMPSGLLASVRGVPLCSGSSGDAGTCGEGSRIGSVDGAAGSGTPFVLEKKGSVYLTEGYKGAPYGLSIVIPVEAGPFTGDLALRTLVVRAAVQVDRRTADVTVVSDPLPQIWHGIPLRVREIVATVDRPDFMVNPSGCTRRQVIADASSPQGSTASPGAPFEATNCSRLGFKPKLTLRLTGRKQMVTSKHPGVVARVTQTGGEAGIRRAEVRLPTSLALDPDNAQALCEFVDGTKPDLENHCPKGSIVGRATAESPLLNRPLTGNVYFVKNVRRDPRTGNAIRTLPMIIAALRGEIAVNLRGESDVRRGVQLVNTFNDVPDAPISRFDMVINGGKSGILAVTRTRRVAKVSLCDKKQIANTLIDGHNGRDYDKNIRMATPCKKGKKKSAKRKQGAKRKQSARQKRR